MSPVLTEGKRLYDGLIGEIQTPARFSREEVLIAIGQQIPVLAVLGKITKAIPATGQPDAGNTGNGTLAAIFGGDDTHVGTYVVTCTATAGGGVFDITAPSGESLPPANAGAPYVNPQINFTITAGGTAFAVGDAFTIEVAPGSGQVKRIDFAADDGSQQAYGITAADYPAAAMPTRGVAFVRAARFIERALEWPEGATFDQKAKALAELKAAGIITAEAA